jgi:hypothetical protein
MALTWLQLLLAAGAFMLLGWSFHVWWLRRQIWVRPDGYGQWVVGIGRAVAGGWPNPTRAHHHADAVRRQIGGHQ